VHRKSFSCFFPTTISQITRSRIFFHRMIFFRMFFFLNTFWRKFIFPNIFFSDCFFRKVFLSGCSLPVSVSSPEIEYIALSWRIIFTFRCKSTWNSKNFDDASLLIWVQCCVPGTADNPVLFQPSCGCHIPTLYLGCDLGARSIASLERLLPSFPGLVLRDWTRCMTAFFEAQVNKHTDPGGPCQQLIEINYASLLKQCLCRKSMAAL